MARQPEVAVRVGNIQAGLWRTNQDQYFVDIYRRFRNKLSRRRNQLRRETRRYAKTKTKAPLIRFDYETIHPDFPGLADVISFRYMDDDGRGRCAFC